MKNATLAGKFRHMFILIIVSSIAASIITYVLAFFLFLRSGDIYQANYYEQQVPGIQEYVKKENVALFSEDGEAGLDATIQGDGLLYLVVDADGNVLYGTNPRRPYQSKEEIYEDFLDKTVLRDGYYIRTTAITDSEGEIKGAVLLSYQIKATYVNTRGKWTLIIVTMALFSPLLYIVVFTFWFSKSFAKSINRPLQLLIDASQKIKEKDLDFEIDYHSENELGKLCDAFSDMKEELRKSLSEQWKMEQERIEMVEALAHDLKSPISIIMGYTDSLLEHHTGNNEKLQQYLEIIRENAGKSSALVQQMQYSADLEKSEIQLNPEPVNIAEFLKQTVYEHELEARKKEITIDLKIDGNMPSAILIDTERLARVIDNVVSNSLQYTPNGGSIYISVKAEKERIFYEVRDNGCGFSSKDLKKAFDKFYRGDESRQFGGSHSGLGLYIVKHLVEQLGGAVVISNVESGGACVQFWHEKVSS